MTGHIYIHDKFKFRDSTEGRKHMVVLGLFNGNTMVVKTTSREKRYTGSLNGCNSNHQFPHFLIAEGTSILRGDSFVCLDDFFAFTPGELVKGSMSRSIIKLGELPRATIHSIILCAIMSPDIPKNLQEYLNGLIPSFAAPVPVPAPKVPV